jgi:nicotinamide-nucleotide amidase
MAHAWCAGEMPMTETFSPMLPNEIEDETQELLERACDQELSLATAESCTGGLLGSLLTDVQGASHAFERGFITYTDEAKHELLGVPKEVLETQGAVSRESAIAMAEGALAHSRADIALSVTGFAGPGGEGDECGLVHFGCARRGRETLHREEHFGDLGRGPIRIECLRTSLSMLREMMG